MPKSVYVVPNFHPACCGWLADWSTERNYCANSYLDHLDRVRDDPSYAFALSEVPNMLAMLQFEPGRVAELKQRIKEGRVELVNAFFLEPTINLSGGEALVKSGVEGLRWQTQVLGARPRFAWMIDVTGTHEQMAQITVGLGLEAYVYTRHNPTGSSLHWAESPDGTRTLAICPGGYAEWGSVFAAREPLSAEQLQGLVKDARERAKRTPAGAPVLIFGGSGDYNLAPQRRSYPGEFLKQWSRVAPETEPRFSTLSKFADAMLPGVKSGAITLPTMPAGTAFSFNAFWIECPRVKSSYRRAEHGLQAAEMLATIASLKASAEYPAQSLYHAWLMMCLNMDRNTLWGSAGGMVFEHDKSWDVRDRFAAVEGISGNALGDSMRALLPQGDAVGFFNPLNWRRTDPVVVKLPPGQTLAKTTCQALLEDEAVLCGLDLPSVGIRGVETVAQPAAAPQPIALPATIETKHYSVRIDPDTGALVSLKLKPSGREMLGGSANVLVAEKPKRQEGDPGDSIVDRHERERLTTSSEFKPKLTVTSGPLATTVEVQSEFSGGGQCRRVMRFYADFPRIDFETELNDIPDRTVVVAEFPLAEAITEVRRGIPYGFSHGAWAKPNPELHGWTKGIVPAVRWSHYTLAGGGGVAILDRGLSGRELTGQTPILFLLNATDKYYGYPNSWLSGKGTHRLSYALVAHDTPWEQARIPQMAWEFNCPPVVVPARARAEAKSFVQTSANVIVEAIRREGSEIELRLAECLGRAGTAEVQLDLPHRDAALTDLLGKLAQQLRGGARHSFPIRPQQIVTMRFRTDRAVDDIKPLLSWELLVPEAKRAALSKRLYRKGHPPRGDELKTPRDSKAAPEDVEAWRELRLGMFIHWGPVSLKGTEIGWSRGGERRGIGGKGEIPLEVYDNLYREFNPTNFNAREWVAVAKAMGARYLVFTTKHHDGFCEWDSALTDYKITRSPFGRDVVKELADACHEAGLKLGFYHSPPDWHHPDYRTERHARYVDYLHGQVKELCTKYGRLDIFWFDGLNSTPQELDSENLLPMIRHFQPHIVINNRSGLPADHDTPEQEIGHFQIGRAWESCITLGDQWAWKPNDNLKSLKQCLHTLIRCAGGDGNLLFNVGPMPDGRIEPRQVERLKEMGAWLGKFGESIYATRGGPFAPGPWGVSTSKGNTVYLHVLSWPEEKLTLPGLMRKVAQSSVLTGGTADVKQADERIEISVPPGDRQTLDTIIALQLDGPAFDAKPLFPPSLAKGKPARASNVYQNMPAHDATKALDGDDETRWATDAGVHEAWLEVDFGAPATIGRAYLSEAYDRVQEFELQAQRDGQWRTFARGGRIGSALELKFDPISAQQVRLNILKATDGPTIWEFQLFGPEK
ncbi:MAG: alpha-L-fucosidase [Verrucomicrobia bacterium]|nr:alpha-L-fucosidase [Verrucomicrobiota bacterium]